MGERMGHTEPFQSGQRTDSRDKGEKVPIKFKMAKERNIGQPDPLAEAIKGRDSYIPRDLHTYRHTKTVKAGGAHYNPAGEYGRPTVGSEHRSRATGIGSHMSRPGGNALGGPTNERGGNPLGGKGGAGTFRGHP